MNISEIPTHTFPVCIDYHKFIEKLENEKGYKVRNFANCKFDRSKNVPYLDFWHWLLDGPFQELSRGGVNYLTIDSLNNSDNNPEFVNIILKDIFDAVKDHPAFDGEVIHFYVNW